MKIPKKLKIGGHEVRVIFPYVFTGRIDIMGQYDDSLKEIRIVKFDGAAERVLSDIWVSFIHEVLHSIDCITGHGVFKNNEPAIEGISNGIFQVLVDNGFLKLDETEDKSFNVPKPPNIREREKAGKIVLRTKGGRPIIGESITDLGTKEKPVVIDKTNIVKMLVAAGKILDEASVPTEGRMFYDPETGEVEKIPEKNRYPVTRPENT